MATILLGCHVDLARHLQPNFDMAKATLELITALRETADRVEAGARYSWGHMAHCNCGQLVQTITRRSGSDIARAVRPHVDEWSEHAEELCGHSGETVEDLFAALAEVGFEREDVIHLERLSDPAVVARMANGLPQRNNRNDLVSYLRAMAMVLEEALPVKPSVSLMAGLTAMAR